MKIGPYTYTVEKDTYEGQNSFDTDKWGDCRFDLQRIRVNSQAHMQVNLVTLFHETLHAIDFINATNTPESAIATLAPLLVMWLEDNGVNLDPLRKIIEEAEEHADRT